MVLINIFRGVKTGKTQMNLLEEGFDPPILIEGETSLEFLRSEEMTEEEIKALLKQVREKTSSSPTPTA